MAARSPSSDKPVRLSAQQARGGDVVLRSRGERAIFILGISAPILVMLAFSILTLA